MAVVRKNKMITKHSKAKLTINFCFALISNFYYAPASLTTSYFTALSSGILMQ